MPSLPVHLLPRSLRGAVALGVTASSRSCLLPAPREPAPWPTCLLPIARRHCGREPLPALGASRPLRHGAASPAHDGLIDSSLYRCGGSRKRRNRDRCDAEVGHESAARWISPKAPLKAGAERDAYGLRATPKRGRAAWLRSGGRAYGPRLDKDAAIAGRDDGAERGLYFLCLQSSIARGFEFIQQTWLANPGFLGLHGELDPIVGMSNGRGHITIPAEPFRGRLTSVPTVVTNRGGGYFFVPSLSPLARIAAGPRH